MTQPQWITLHILSEGGRDALIQAVASALTATGAVQYDPFGTMPGLSYPRAVKLFAAPSENRWIRLIASPDSALEPVIAAADGLVAKAEIDVEIVPSLSVYKDGERVDTLAALTPFAVNPTAFAALLAAPKTGALGIGGVSGGALPANVRAMSSGLPTRQIERMMNSMTGSMSKSERAGAQAALKSVDWESGAGLWMRDILSTLGQPAQEYATLSTAYRTARRLARNPAATLYPGDADARAAFPDALDYAPVFYGWKD